MIKCHKQHIAGLKAFVGSSEVRSSDQKFWRLTFSQLQQRLWRPWHVINDLVERLKVVKEGGRVFIHGHGVNDLQSQWKSLLTTGMLIKKTKQMSIWTSMQTSERRLIIWSFHIDQRVKKTRGRGWHTVEIQDLNQINMQNTSCATFFISCTYSAMALSLLISPRLLQASLTHQQERSITKTSTELYVWF